MTTSDKKQAGLPAQGAAHQEPVSAIEALRRDLVGCVEKELSPIALRYRYATTPLESNIKWRPVVLLLGNYSSGKSTLINELLGVKVQNTGQAPTDDSFTVITGAPSGGSTVGVQEERDGKALINDGHYPFASLARHGQRFAAHFRLKTINSPFLHNLALIDTPGMVDSVAERDRGYDYQEVVGDLAQIADLILVMFDPHKAGTIRETYESLRRTLPKSTYEDRVLFVLNRIDECTNLNDLLRVYGTLCWNLSQMTGRKDIPMIHLTYSPNEIRNGEGPDFLRLLENQRDRLTHAIQEAPKHRLDHLATYIEEHGERLEHLLEALLIYATKRRNFLWRKFGSGAAVAATSAFFIYWLLYLLSSQGMFDVGYLNFGAALALIAGLWGWYQFVSKRLLKKFHDRQMDRIDFLTAKDWQRQKEVWDSVKPLVQDFLERQNGRVRVMAVRRDHKRVRAAWQRASRDARKAMSSPTGVPG